MESRSFSLIELTNEQLLAGVKKLVSQEREATTYLIAHLSELDLRRLYLEEGCSSLFKYCTQVLHLSESAAYRRIEVARIARKYPVLFGKLAEDSINLTAVLVLAPALTPENHRHLLEAATHKSKEEVEALVAAVRPRPAVPAAVRKLPQVSFPEPALQEDGTLPMNAMSRTMPAEPEPVKRRGEVAPLSPELYKIQFTASAETYEKLRQLQELLRHQVPNGDLATIVDRALTLLLDQVTREKLAKVKRPRKKVSIGPTEERPKRGVGMVPETRHIPAEVKREIWERDGGKCAFVAKNGRRCSERGWLEFHHVEPYGLEGLATLQNIELRCRAHNMYEGELVFGVRPDRVGGKRSGSESIEATRAGTS